MDGASAFSNVVQRVSAALGLAALTSLVTITASGAALALMLRSGPAPSGGPAVHHAG